MKSIHAFSAILPGHGVRPAQHPSRSLVPSPRIARAPRGEATGDGIGAISALLSIALFQRGVPAKKTRAS